MSLSIGIVGLPNVGKSTLFQALTKKEVLIANYPFATIDPNVGVVAVPDERVEKLAVFSRSEKKVPAIVEFVDIAGLVRGANKGEGLGNQFLAHIREVDAVIYMIRAFEDPSILHVEARVDPKDDIEILTTELMLKDLETVEKHWEKLTKDAKGGNKDAIRQMPILEKVRDGLRDGVMAYKTFLNEENSAQEEVCEKLKRDLQLLTS
ncbi:MAG: redox-regulated ATPase YchF, partial [Candidatus Spechtbacteria bacterium]|nr:redox-regulated ATPase YchF [Candidatus Spechtbacteria bacterium]